MKKNTIIIGVTVTSVVLMLSMFWGKENKIDLMPLNDWSNQLVKMNFLPLLAVTLLSVVGFIFLIVFLLRKKNKKKNMLVYALESKDLSPGEKLTYIKQSRLKKRNWLYISAALIAAVGVFEGCKSVKTQNLFNLPLFLWAILTSIAAGIILYILSRKKQPNGYKAWEDPTVYLALILVITGLVLWIILLIRWLRSLPLRQMFSSWQFLSILVAVFILSLFLWKGKKLLKKRAAKQLVITVSIIVVGVLAYVLIKTYQHQNTQKKEMITVVVKDNTDSLKAALFQYIVNVLSLKYAKAEDSVSVLREQMKQFEQIRSRLETTGNQKDSLLKHSIQLQTDSLEIQAKLQVAQARLKEIEKTRDSLTGVLVSTKQLLAQKSDSLYERVGEIMSLKSDKNDLRQKLNQERSGKIWTITRQYMLPIGLLLALVVITGFVIKDHSRKKGFKKTFSHLSYYVIAGFLGFIAYQFLTAPESELHHASIEAERKIKQLEKGIAETERFYKDSIDRLKKAVVTAPIVKPKPDTVRIPNPVDGFLQRGIDSLKNVLADADSVRKTAVEEVIAKTKKLFGGKEKTIDTTVAKVSTNQKNKKQQIAEEKKEDKKISWKGIIRSAGRKKINHSCDDKIQWNGIIVH